ncbi:MAG: hypothetical protein RL417_978 [Pseudomonadota bacterium]|jgi:CBS domain containing-hemolysin-like protein
MSLLLFTLGFSLVVSFCCSLAEAVLISVPMAHVRSLASGGGRAAARLLRCKEEMPRSISAILILNTIANTAGSAVAGSVVGELYGPQALAVFAALMTLAILYASEIFPKILGVTYSREFAIFLGVPLSFFVALFSPLIKVSEAISKRIRPANAGPSISLDELLSMAAIGTEQGALDRFEGSVINNVIGLDTLLVKDVLTPRVVVFRVDEALTLGDIAPELVEWSFTRVPTYSLEDPDHLTGYVRQRDLYRELIRGNRNSTLKSLARPLEAVPELMRVDRLLLQMFEKREQICAVVDEHGGLAGIITLEDVIEEIVGREIVDEYDAGRAKGAGSAQTSR